MMLTPVEVQEIEFDGIKFAAVTGKVLGCIEEVQRLTSLGLSFVQVGDQTVGILDNTAYAFHHGTVNAVPIGSRITKNDIGFRPSTLDDFIVQASKQYSSVIPTMCGAVCEVGILNFEPGPGEWKAETLLDAAHMAADIQKHSALLAEARALGYATRHSSILSNYRVSSAQNAAALKPKRICFIYDHEITIMDKTTGDTVRELSIKDGEEICMTISGTKVIGRYVAIRGQLESWFSTKRNEAQTSMPVTFTFPLDYPVFA